MRALQPLAINIPQRPRSLWSPSSTYSPFEYRYCEEALKLLNRLEDVLLLARSAATDLTGPVGVPFKKLLSSSLTELLEKPASYPLSPPHELDLYASLANSPPSQPSPLEEADARRLLLASKALRLAALAFLDAAIREFFDSPPYPGSYANRLKLQFLGSRALANDSPWGRSLEMVVAVLLQADRMALERPWRAWYVADALTLTMRIGEWTWDLVVQSLKEWVLQGGLDADTELDGVLENLEREKAQEKERKKERERERDEAGRERTEKGEEKNDEEDVEILKRSRGVWDLKLVAMKFLEEWDELPAEGKGLNRAVRSSVDTGIDMSGPMDAGSSTGNGANGVGAIPGVP